MCGRGASLLYARPLTSASPGSLSSACPLLWSRACGVLRVRRTVAPSTRVCLARASALISVPGAMAVAERLGWRLAAFLPAARLAPRVSRVWACSCGASFAFWFLCRWWSPDPKRCNIFLAVSNTETNNYSRTRMYQMKNSSDLERVPGTRSIGDEFLT